MIPDFADRETKLNQIYRPEIGTVVLKMGATVVSQDECCFLTMNVADLGNCFKYKPFVTFANFI